MNEGFSNNIFDSIADFLSENWLWVAGGALAFFLFCQQRSPVASPAWRRGDTRIPLAPGVVGTQQTLAVMAQMVRRDAGDAFVRKLAESIAKECPGHGFECEVKALYEFCRDKITYRRDPVEIERVQDTRRMLESGAGDCDDKVVLLCSLLGSLGHRTRFALLSNSPDNFSHVFAQVYVRGRGWLDLDPTPERAEVGWRGKALRQAYYEIWPQKS